VVSCFHASMLKEKKPVGMMLQVFSAIQVSWSYLRFSKWVPVFCYPFFSNVRENCASIYYEEKVGEFNSPNLTDIKGL